MLYLLIGYMWLFIHRPFEVWPWLAAYHIERVYMIVIFCYWMLLVQKTWTSNRLNLAFLAVTTSVLLSAILSPLNPDIHPTVENHLKTCVFYVLVMSTIRTEKQLRILLVAFIAIVALYAGHSFREFLNGRQGQADSIARLIGVDVYLGHANSFGPTLVYSLPIIYPLWYEAGTGWHKILLIGYVLLASVCIILTGSRTALVGFALLCSVAVVCSKYRFRFAIGIIVAASLIWGLLREDRKVRYLSIVDSSYGSENARVSAVGRVQGWWDGVTIWREYPLFGVGTGSFEIARGYDLASHNLYGQILGELGTVGAFAFVFLLWTFFANWRCARRMATNMPTLRTTMDYRLCTAVIITVGLLLVMGFAGHNLYRPTWIWYGAFQAIALHRLTIRHSEDGYRNPLDPCDDRFPVSWRNNAIV